MIPITTTPMAINARAAGREPPKAAPQPIANVTSPSSSSATELRSKPVCEQLSARLGFES